MDTDGAATRAAYDATADLYSQRIGTELSAATEGPVDRALLSAFVELVGSSPPPRVADVGCGPGRVAAFLAAHGIEAIGIDVSSQMLAAGRAAHPGIPFGQGGLTALPFQTGSLAGVVCWYSIIHTPPPDLAGASAELRRVLAPGGHLLVAFQAGAGEPVHRTEIQGRKLELTNYRHAPDAVARCLADAGLEVHARIVREPELAHESTPQAFLLGRKTGPEG